MRGNEIAMRGNFLKSIRHKSMDYFRTARKLLSIYGSNDAQPVAVIVFTIASIEASNIRP